MKSRILRPAIAALVLLLTVYWAGPGEVWSILSSSDPFYFLLLLLISLPLIWASCLKWQLFLAAQGYTVGLNFLMKQYTISYFFNTFAPSFIGGDISRSLSVGKRVGSKRDAFLSTFLERFTGLLAMAVMSLIFLSFADAVPLMVVFFVIAVVAITGVAAFCLFSKRIAALVYPAFIKLTAAVGLRRLHSFSDKMFEGLEYARGNKKLFWQAMAYSLLFHVLTVLNTYIAALTIGWDAVPLWGLFVVVPLVLLVGMIPITPGGLGLQEGAFAYFLGQIGATISQGLGVGLILRVKVLVLAIFGALLWAFDNKNAKQKNA